jgi:hypothetical protein
VERLELKFLWKQERAAEGGSKFKLLASRLQARCAKSDRRYPLIRVTIALLEGCTARKMYENVDVLRSKLNQAHHYTTSYRSGRVDSSH